jgi:hypothetical protein
VGEEEGNRKEKKEKGEKRKGRKKCGKFSKHENFQGGKQNIICGIGR